MAIKVAVKKNAYYDSVTLMAVSGQVKGVAGVTEAVVNMGTAMNKELMKAIGLLTEEAAGCGPDDLLIAVRAGSDEICEDAILAAEQFLAQLGKTKSGGGRAVRPTTIASALKMAPLANLAVISVPGAYAGSEAMNALRQGLHVMLFSDNVSLAEERKLKEYAHQQGLLMMGPDCGTAIINGVGLCFANAVRRGNIGIVGASGTGTQEVTVQIDKLGGGLSQVLGTGGRDLKEEIGGIMMLDCIEALAKDPATEVVVLISKPPAQSVAAKITNALKTCGKPAVVCFLHSIRSDGDSGPVHFCSTLEETAVKAMELAGIKSAGICPDPAVTELADKSKSRLAPGQRTIRGLFCGGTLCGEAGGIVTAETGINQGHRFIDLGDDEYTLGKPHPMIEPGLRLPFILEAAADPAVAVILLDVVIGSGSHADPAGVVAPAVREAEKIALAAGRQLIFVAYVCGTDKDPQDRREQEGKLKAEGVLLAGSNAAAARVAAAIVS